MSGFDPIAKAGMSCLLGAAIWAMLVGLWAMLFHRVPDIAWLAPSVVLFLINFVLVGVAVFKDG